MNIGVIVALGIVVLLVLYVVAAYNGFVRLKNMVEEAFSTMDVYLKKRFDLIPNLVETVKGYAAHEKGTLDAVTKARSMIAQGGSAEERMENENILSGALRSLFAVSENYPDLKANQNFIERFGRRYRKFQKVLQRRCKTVQYQDRGIPFKYNCIHIQDD